LYLTRAAGSSLDLGQRLSNIQLLDGETVLANATVVDGWATLAFENMNSANFVVNAGQSRPLSVRATVNNVLNSDDVDDTDGVLRLAIGTGSYTAATAGTVNGARFVSQANGSVINPSSVWLVVSNAHRIVRGRATVASATTTATNSRLLNFTVTAEWNRVKLQDVSFTLRNVAPWAPVEVTLYRDSVSPSNRLGTWELVFTTTWANSSWLTLTLNNPEEISAWATASYILEVSGYNPAETAWGNFLSRQFQLNDLTYLDVFNNDEVPVSNLASYVNAWTFPLVAPSFNPAN